MTTGYEVSLPDFYRLIGDPCCQPTMARLLDEWFGYRIRGERGRARNTVEHARLVDPYLLTIVGVFEPDTTTAEPMKLHFIQVRHRELDRRMRIVTAAVRNAPAVDVHRSDRPRSRLREREGTVPGAAARVENAASVREPGEVSVDRLMGEEEIVSNSGPDGLSKRSESRGHFRHSVANPQNRAAPDHLRERGATRGARSARERPVS